MVYMNRESASSPTSTKVVCVTNPMYQEDNGEFKNLACEIFQTDEIGDVSDYQSTGDDAAKGNNSHALLI